MTLRKVWIFQASVGWDAVDEMLTIEKSPEDIARPQVKDILAIEEEFRLGEGC